jgi:hypothetical protein
MIRDTEAWRRWEDDLTKSQPPDYARAVQLVEALYQEARALGVFPPLDQPLLPEHKARLAQALNVPRSAGTHRARS